MRINPVLGIVFAVAVAFGFMRSGAYSGNKPAAIPDAAPGQSQTAPRPVKDNVVAYHTGDDAMNAAKSKAKSTLQRFHKLMADRAPGVYTVKFPLTQNGATEHIWLQIMGDQGDQFVGLLAHDPVNGSNYRKGDRMVVAAADVEDWMIRTKAEIYGGYTARVAIANLPQEQQERYRAMFRD